MITKRSFIRSKRLFVFAGPALPEVVALLPFSRLVVIDPGRYGVSGTVRSVKDAAECLVESWPKRDRGKCYRIALEACLDCIQANDEREVESVRWAFIAAAKEVGIFVRETRIQ